MLLVELLLEDDMGMDKLLRRLATVWVLSVEFRGKMFFRHGFRPKEEANLVPDEAGFVGQV